VDFTQAELDSIESACRAQSGAYRDLAAKAERPIQRNQRMDAADTLAAIAEKIQGDRRMRAQLARGCPNCDD
jgi:hypothetical protein